MLPAAVENATGGPPGSSGELAVLRVLHAHPQGFAAAGQPLVTAYPVVLQAFKGGWWSACIGDGGVSLLRICPPTTTTTTIPSKD